MNARKYPWAKLPTAWIIEDNGLRNFKWDRGRGADNIAALMILIALAHNADRETGTVNMTYENLADVTLLSRAKISNGLDKLLSEKLIERTAKRSGFLITNYQQIPWAKLPLKAMYDSGSFVSMFNDFKLRKSTELNALKIFLLIAAFRTEDMNKAFIGFEKIQDYTGIDGSNISRALSVLSVHGIVITERYASKSNAHGVAHAYRLAGVDSFRHSGTTGRKDVEGENAEIVK